MTSIRPREAGSRRAPRPRAPRLGLRAMLTDDSGMSTAEYAIGTIGAAAFAGLLYAIVTGDPVTAALTGIIERALSVNF